MYLLNNCLTPQQQLLLALRYYANRSFLAVAGDFAGLSKSTASKTVRRVSKVLASKRSNYIKIPDTPEALAKAKQSFYNIARFPRCIGAIDCTHIKIVSPGGSHAELFRNRKQFFSLNVQTVSDADLKLCNIVCRWPRSAHDSYILTNSQLCRQFESGHFGNSLLVGDKGYPIKRYLMTPLNTTTTPAEELYNESIIRTRNVMERSYRVWKRRFPSLAMGLRVHLDTAQAITVGTAVLHNIACSNNEAMPPISPEQENAINMVYVDNVETDPVNIRLPQNAINNVIRTYLINNYFANLLKIRKILIYWIISNLRHAADLASQEKRPRKNWSDRIYGRRIPQSPSRELATPPSEQNETLDAVPYLVATHVSGEFPALPILRCIWKDGDCMKDEGPKRI
ncbi:unnamed protein product [Acanthoscelides obtectus]|uniref:DDE Tnp4 domain-containing protein n=1 Tax=Acanthoscelides obtectus TaxID=200917 RepID=A0A9P0PQM8_ACAOB|nr:unnamed protein product [Acanthoscelides obtectus]CAK1633646.1 Putative nuclease HARBI1 [Acanthoscelides obtectus]